MRSIAVLAAVAAVMAVTVAQAASVPSFDVSPSCRSAAQRAVPIGDPGVCVRQEQQAREQLRRQWNSFARDDKAQCVSLATMGGLPSYTELLTCLELSREARNLHHNSAPGTTDGSRMVQ